MLKTTKAERTAILGDEPESDDIGLEFIDVGHHYGGCGQTWSAPDETRVDRLTKSARVAWRWARQGCEVYVVRKGDFKRGDCLAIHDGRDIARELGCGPAGGYNMIKFDASDTLANTAQNWDQSRVQRAGDAAARCLTPGARESYERNPESRVPETYSGAYDAARAINRLYGFAAVV